MTTAAIIPVKSFSEGIKNKNLKSLGGTPLWEYALNAALGSNLVDTTFVTTDDLGVYEQVSQMNHNLVQPLRRPSEHTMDNVQVDEVALFALRQIQEAFGKKWFDTIVILQPTSPFRTALHVTEALELYHVVKTDSVMGVRELGYTYAIQDGLLYPIAHKPHERTGRQESDDENDYILEENGAIYIVNAQEMSRRKTFRASPFVPFFMDWVSSIELDEPLDWIVAEALVEYIYGGKEIVHSS